MSQIVKDSFNIGHPTRAGPTHLLSRIAFLAVLDLVGHLPPCLRHFKEAGFLVGGFRFLRKGKTFGGVTAKFLGRAHAKKYRQYAADCRSIAQSMAGGARNTLLKIAEAWDEVAHAREVALKKRNSNTLEPEPY